MNTFLLGSVAVFFFRLHIRYEVRRWARRKGFTREEVRAAGARAYDKRFCEAWQEGEG